MYNHIFEFQLRAVLVGGPTEQHPSPEYRTELAINIIREKRTLRDKSRLPTLHAWHRPCHAVKYNHIHHVTGGATGKESGRKRGEEEENTNKTDDQRTSFPGHQVCKGGTTPSQKIRKRGKENKRKVEETKKTKTKTRPPNIIWMIR
jgi:hypothetical protein